MKELLSDLYYLPRRRHALGWAYKHLSGSELALVLRHARSIPYDQDLSNLIAIKLQRQQQQGIGQAIQVAEKKDEDDDEPAPTKKPDSGGSPWLLILTLAGLGYLAFSGPKKRESNPRRPRRKRR